MTTVLKKTVFSFLAPLFFVAGCASAPPPPPAPPPVLRAESVTDYEKNSAASYRIDVDTNSAYGHGSGVVISPDGYILTADHVAEYASKTMVTVLIQEGTKPPVTYTGALVATDKEHDLAVVRVARRFAEYATIEDDFVLRPGDGVYTIGYPMKFGQMIARGHVQRLHYSDVRSTANGEKITVYGLALADFVTSSGGSGGGVFNESDGRLVGVMRALIYDGGDDERLTYRGFVPVEQVRAFLETNRIPYMQANGKVKTYPPPAPPKPAAAPPKEQPPAPAKPHDGDKK